MSTSAAAVTAAGNKKKKYSRGSANKAIDSMPNNLFSLAITWKVRNIKRIVQKKIIVCSY